MEPWGTPAVIGNVNPSITPADFQFLTETVNNVLHFSIHYKSYSSTSNLPSRLY